MSRLVTFGCSFTYGHGLPDCRYDGDSEEYNDPKQVESPSKYAWPQVAADTLGVECVNMAKPGIGNKHILYRIVNFDFEPTDIVVVMWSYFDRHSVILNNGSVEDLSAWRISDDNQESTAEPGYTAQASNAYYVSPRLASEMDSLFSNAIYINYADSFLKNLGVHYVHTCIRGYGTLELRSTIRWFSENKYEKSFVDAYWSAGKRVNKIKPTLIFGTVADDDFPTDRYGHPGLNAHKSFSYQIVKHIKQKVDIGA